MPAEHHEWEPMTAEEASQLFGALSIPWWVAGGVALDLFVGRTTREHGDFDVLILRRDQLVMQEYLRGWDLHKTNQPGLKPWPAGEYLELGVNQVWCRRTPESLWALEIMFMDTVGDRWVYRRAPSIGGLVTSLGRKTPDGIPYLSPEIQLLYKARQEPEMKDQKDFNTVLPLLSETQKLWLQSALEVQFSGGHPWSRRLDGERAQATQSERAVGGG